MCGLLAAVAPLAQRATRGAPPDRATEAAAPVETTAAASALEPPRGPAAALVGPRHLSSSSRLDEIVTEDLFHQRFVDFADAPDGGRIQSEMRLLRRFAPDVSIYTLQWAKNDYDGEKIYRTRRPLYEEFAPKDRSNSTARNDDENHLRPVVIVNTHEKIFMLRWVWGWNLADPVDSPLMQDVLARFAVDPWGVVGARQILSVDAGAEGRGGDVASKQGNGFVLWPK